MAVAAKKGKKRKAEKSRSAALSEEGLQSRERILDAAEKEFARKGFDGARVDEIAKEAGVNKALIYYYFESKKELLEELVNRAIRGLVAEKQAALDFSSVKGALLKGEIPDELMRRGVEVTSRWLPIFGTLCGEAFKDDEEAPALFRVMDRYLASIIPVFEKMGLEPPNLEEIRFPGVFFGLAPLLFFQLLKDKWIEYYKVDRKEFEEKFYSSFAEIYRSAFRHLLAKKR